jgi:hypothetical protein
VGAGKEILVGALLGGLTAIHPTLGAVASHAYSSYSYESVGIGLFSIYRKWKSGQETGAEAVKDATGVGSGVIAGRAADRTAERMVSELRKSGAIDKIGEQTGVNTKIYSQMLQGSISAAESQGFSELAKYAVGKVVDP